ncbi:hypothetical protein AAFF_G00397250 [Aldrovandia affinis]|uniref:TNFR-Cys domain-containing protein n=1 Tax=Aldrovandia affinis TaxID=143900 RepID=A0AAD7SDK9_9TELE|nr:hypothetical protein AAFF_G00397250 [Aldrovandia affinis]
MPRWLALRLFALWHQSPLDQSQPDQSQSSGSWRSEKRTESTRSKQPRRSHRTTSFFLFSEPVWSRSPRMVWRSASDRLLKVLIMGSCLVVTAAEDPQECMEQEYRDRSGSCVACEQCDAGHELSKECGFGYGANARCIPCRTGRYKEDGGVQKCKPCLDCSLLNRLQKANCSTATNAMCGDCLPGFYRKTKLSGFQDMECIPCGNPPPPYEPHCSGRVNLVPLQSTVSSPRDVALAAVICSALASVLLALLILCVIYCKRQLLEKKPAALAQSQDGPYSGAELSCLDQRQVHELPHRACCHCHQHPGHTCGPALIPSLCCDEACTLSPSRDPSPFRSRGGLDDRLWNLMEDRVPGSLADRPCVDSAEMWALTRDSPQSASLDLWRCERDPTKRDTDRSRQEEEPPGPNLTLLGVQAACPADGPCDPDHSGSIESLRQPAPSPSQG